MNRIKVFFITLWRFLRLNPLYAAIPACALGVAAATVTGIIIVNSIKSEDVIEEVSSGVLSEFTLPVLPQEEEIISEAVEEVVSAAAPVQPVEKQVTYKGKQINVAKVEIAQANSKEDAQNGTYIVEKPKQIIKNVKYKKPQSPRIGGIDVSSHNGQIDWAKVKAAGVQFAMIRCGYRGYLTGKIVTDATFNYNIENAYKNGIDVGIYFYSTAVNEQEALEEAAYVAELIKQNEEKGVKIKYPVAYDFEEFYNTDDRSRSKNLNAAQISNNTSAFLDYIKTAGYTPMLYAGKNPIKKHWVSGMASKYNYWLAHYTEATEYEGNFFMWQYTSSGSVDGIPGRVDLNLCGLEGGNNQPRFLICKEPGVKAYNKPEDGAEVKLSLEKDTVYLSRNTFNEEYKEIKIEDKYYYVHSDELHKIPFEKSKYEYKAGEEAVLYSKPFNDTYKTKTVLKIDTPVTVTGVWGDKWAEISYEKKTYYITPDKLIITGEIEIEEPDTGSSQEEPDSSDASCEDSSQADSDTEDTKSENTSDTAADGPSEETN